MANSLSAYRKPGKLVSVIIPFLNQEEFLTEAIESIFLQSYQNWELILVDDGSTDRSRQIAEDFVRKYPTKIQLFNHAENKNLGASASRNLGISHASGEYVTFLDSDDIFFPYTLELEVETIEKYPLADAVCGTLECWYSWSDKATKKEKDFKVDLMLETNKLYQPKYLLIHNLRAGGRKPGITCIMLKLEFVKKYGLYEEKFNYVWEDQVFWAKTSLHGKIFVMDECVAKYRQHPASSCAVVNEDDSYIHSTKVFLEWLENYLHAQKFNDENIWKSLKNFRRKVYYETKFKRLKRYYQKVLPLYARYWLRDRLTGLKNLLRSSHR